MTFTLFIVSIGIGLLLGVLFEQQIFMMKEKLKDIIKSFFALLILPLLSI